MTVLVIDDEEVIRTLALRILEKAGHTVLTATSGEEGVALFRQPGATINLVVLDARMPGLSGEQTLRQIRDSAPCMPCILSSGSLEIEQDLADELRSNTWFLRKPYQSKDLIALVARVTGASGPGSPPANQLAAN
jgi:DNA-binding NtrC family response regulator